jgi:hypothetical protein
MLRSFVTRLARFAFPLVLAAAAGTVAAQTLSFGNSPGGYPGTVSFAGGTASLQTGTPIDLSDYSGGYFDFSFQTGTTADGWTFAPGGTVSMVVGAGFNNGIDLNGDSTPDILPGTTLFTGVLGQTTVRDRRGPPDEYGNRYEPCDPMCIGSDFDISASFTVSNLHSGYAAARGVPTGNYTGSFLLGIDSWGGGAATQQVYWRQVSMTLDQQTAPIPEPETYAMMLAGLGLLGFAARRRKQKPNA